MVSGVVYRPFGLVELSRERVDGGDEILAQGRRNSVSLPASEVYRPAVYRLRIYRSSLPVKSLPAEGLLAQSLPANGRLANSLPARSLSS